eukprot:1183101-Prorocentrum_minimum.AAC.1
MQLNRNIPHPPTNQSSSIGIRLRPVQVLDRVLEACWVAGDEPPNLTEVGTTRIPLSSRRWAQQATVGHRSALLVGSELATLQRGEHADVDTWRAVTGGGSSRGHLARRDWWGIVARTLGAP